MLLRERLGRLHFALSVLGTNLTFFPMFFLGRDGMTRRVADYPADAGWSTLNAVASAGALCIALSLLVFAVNVIVSLRRPVPAGDDPWEAHTLEWLTRSPPPAAQLRRSAAADPLAAPLLDVREEAA